MDNTIAEMFKEKNNQILVQKLALDIANNTNSLQLTIDNKISLFIPKLMKRVSEYFNNYNIDYNMIDLDEYFQQQGEELKSDFKELLRQREEKFGEDVRCKEELQLADIHQFLETSEKHLQEQTPLFLNDFTLIQTKNYLIGKYKFKEEEAMDAFISMLSQSTIQISNTILETMRDRSGVLQNMINETYNKYIDLKKNTSEKDLEETPSSSKSKKKIHSKPE